MDETILSLGQELDRVEPVCERFDCLKIAKIFNQKSLIRTSLEYNILRTKKREQMVLDRFLDMKN
jgi:hypothetical protein